MNTKAIQKSINTLVERLATQAEAAIKKALKNPGRMQRVLARKTGELIFHEGACCAADCGVETVIVPSFQVPFTDLAPEDNRVLIQLVLDQLSRVLLPLGIKLHQTREVVSVIIPDPSRGEYVDNNIPLLGDHPGYV